MKDKNRTRDKYTQVWLSDSDKRTLLQKAALSKRSQSDYIRTMIKYGNIPNYNGLFSLENQKRLIDEINSIGVNVNQVAYKAKSSGNADKSKLDEILDLLDSIMVLLEQIVRER